MIRVLIVNRVRLTGDLMAAVLKDESDIRVVGLARSADEALAFISGGRVDVALVNIDMPETEAFRLARTVARSHKNTKVVVTGLLESKAAMLRCVEEGAAGYVLEEESVADMLKKVRAVYANEFYVSAVMGGLLASRLAELKRMVAEYRSLNPIDPTREAGELTEREREVLALIAQGKSNQEIADDLIIQLGTVKNHVHNILNKLDVQNRKHAVVVARQLLAKDAARRTAAAA